MTIYDIAKEAGVSASTVSRVMNQKPGVKAETQEKVKKLLKKYNYIPNETARGLVMQSTKTIGILIEDIRVTHHTDSAYVIEQEMTKRGYCCITMNTGTTGEKKAEYIRILEQRRVDGAILIGSMFETKEVEEGIKRHLTNVPVVIVNGHINLPNVSGVIVDEDAGVEQCVELLHKKGRRNIAFALDIETPSNEKKRQGYIRGMQRIGWQEEDLWIYQAEEKSLRGGYELTKKILQNHSDLEGIIYAVDLIAAGGVRAAYDMGVAVPKQVALIGVDSSLYGEICFPKLTSLDNKLEELSRTAATILLDGLEHGAQSRKLMLFSDIIEREST